MADAAPNTEAPPANPAVEALLAANASAAASPGPGTGTVTPAMSELPADQRDFSLKVSLADLSAKGTGLYAHKKYEEAAEVFAQAAEMQAEINGEMHNDNAEVLFLYGRALFEVGKNKSDVLGGKAPETQQPKKVKKAKAEPEAEVKNGGEADEAQQIAEEKVAIIAAQTTEGKKEVEAADKKKALFQFTGDENWDDSDEEEGAEGEEGEGEDEEEDDLAVSFEILEMAKLFFKRQMEEAAKQDGEADAESKGKDKAEETETNGANLKLRHIKERLADTHDLLAEIALENERYPDAVNDFRESLKYKQELHTDIASEVLAEAHFKLSLALEFSSVTKQSGGDDQQAAGGSSSAAQAEEPVDQALRDEAATEMEAAIASQRAKLQNKEVELATLHSVEDNEVTRRQIAECKELIAEMEQRLVDLRKPPIDVEAAVGLAGNAMGGILGQALGESAEQTEARITEAKKTAKDLSGLVRKKPVKDEKAAATEAAATNGSETNGKRKAEDDLAGDESDGKKAKVEDAVEAA